MCGDLIDRAAAHADAMREAAIVSARRGAPSLPARGECFNCEAPLANGLRFCDTYCMEDWQRQCDAITRQGLT